MVNNSSGVTYGLQHEVRTMSARSFEHLPQEGGDESLDPIEDFDSSSKARETESKVSVLCKVEAYCDSFGMVRFSLVVGSEDFMFCGSRCTFVDAVPLPVGR